MNAGALLVVDCRRRAVVLRSARTRTDEYNQLDLCSICLVIAQSSGDDMLVMTSTRVGWANLTGTTRLLMAG